MSQLTLWDDCGRAASPPATAGAALLERLRAFGLPPFERVTTHRNRQVMVSWLPGRWFRVHEGYAHAADPVLQAIVRFATPGIRQAARLEARRIFLAFPAERHAPPRRTHRAPAPRSGDIPLLTHLQATHAELNALHFEGRLGPMPIRLSDRMRRRLGEIRLDRHTARPLGITLSRRHVRRDGWVAVSETLLHEMVHQWQAETGRPVDHGAEFRQMAMAVGIEPRAVRRQEPARLVGRTGRGS